MWGDLGISNTGRHTEIRISVSEEDSVGTGKAPFFKEVGRREETEIKTKGLGCFERTASKHVYYLG